MSTNNDSQQYLKEKFRKYNFQIKHLFLVFGIICFFLILVTFIQKLSLQTLLLNTQRWYQQDFAERLANLTATSLELLLETASQEELNNDIAAQEMIQAFNILFSQQVLQHQVDEVAIIVTHKGNSYIIDNGMVLYQYFFRDSNNLPPISEGYQSVLALYDSIHPYMQAAEEVQSIPTDNNSFRVFVPFVPKGEFLGAVYVQNTPDFSFITEEVLANYNETALFFSALILFGLLAVFYVSSYLMNERDTARESLFTQEQDALKKSIDQQKEHLFTKRIYHTHHKAEKVMGFIKEDLRNLSAENIEESKYRVTKYANFMSRVIYDMKWYEPPLHAIRNTIFQTDLNALIRFIVKNIFLRIASDAESVKFKLDLDETFPPVRVNEFIIWEILEPLIQNSIDHGGEADNTIQIKTYQDPDGEKRYIAISDTGKGIPANLLEKNEDGVQLLFLENISTKNIGRNSGYGCYLAYEISKRCGWEIMAENLDQGGCRTTLTLKTL